MPEGHKTHRLARDHHKQFARQTIRLSSPQGRFAAGARELSGQTLKRIEAFGKHLFYRFDDDRSIHVHLGRYGKVQEYALPAGEPRGQVRMRFLAEQRGFDLTGPTVCAVIDADARRAVLDRLGPDPLRNDNPEPAWERIAKSNREIGGLLLDQKVLAGVGNIFRAEVLWDLKLDPTRPGSDLDREEFDRLWAEIVRTMKVGLRYGKIVTVTREEAGKPLSKVSGLDRFHVYKKPECPRCETPIHRWEQANRTMYACPVCQEMELLP